MTAAIVHEGGAVRGGVGGAAGAPLVLVLGRASEAGEAPEHAELLERVARYRGRPFGQIFIQEHRGGGFSLGEHRLGDTVDQAVEALRPIVATLAPRELIAFGRGLGGHAALLFGVRLGAGRIVAVAPPAHLDARELALYNDRRWQDLLDGPAGADPARRADAVALLAGYGGRAYVLFGTRRQNEHHDAVHLNVVHAYRLALSDRVTLCPFPDLGQDLLDELAERGEAEPLLAHHLFDEVPPPESPPPLDREKLNLITAKLHQKFTFQICTKEEDLDDAFGDDPAEEAEPVSFAVAGEVDPTATRKVDDGWRRWIAGNLMLGAPPAGLEDTLVGHGISEQEASEEVWRAMQSPYLWGSQLLQNRLKKRDWLLASYRKLQRLRPGSAEVPRRRSLSRAAFLRAHYSAGRPVILSGLIDGWPALRGWDLDALCSRFADRPVEVHIARDALNDVEPALEVEARTMTMAALAERLRQLDDADSTSLTAAPGSGNHPALAELWDDLGPIGEYLDGGDPRPGTIRLASAGAMVPFRLELASTLVAQVTGSTRFLLVPSWDLPLMRNTGYVFTQIDGRTMTPDPHPPPDEPQAVECLLAPGEVLFLPVGWWSFTEALEATATVSFTNLAFDNDFAGDFPGDVDA